MPPLPLRKRASPEPRTIASHNPGDEDLTFVAMNLIRRRSAPPGSGTGPALPLPKAMCPAFTAAGQPAARPLHRIQAYYIPNGTAMEYWTPSTVGRTFELTPVLTPLSPSRDQGTVI